MFNSNKKGNNEEITKTTEIERFQIENEKLFSQLTNKNTDYFFQLEGRLDELGYDPTKKVVVLNQMLHETVEFQEDAITARRKYGTVTERADEIMGITLSMLTGEPEISPDWMLYMDGALLLGGLFSIVNGASAWRSADMNLSLVQLIMNFVLGGLVVLVLIKFRPEKGQMKGMLRYTFVTILVMLVWVFLMTFVEVIAPSVINPNLPELFVIGVGVAGLALRWYLKSKLDIRGTLF